MDPRTSNYPIYDVKPSYVAHGLSPTLMNLWRQSQAHLSRENVMSGENCDMFPIILPAVGSYHLPQLNELSPPSNSNSVYSYTPNMVSSQGLGRALDGGSVLVNPNSHHGHHNMKPHTHMNCIRSGSTFHANELMDEDHNSFPAPLPESYRELLLQESTRVPDSGPNSDNIINHGAVQPPKLYGSVGTLMAGMQQYYHALEGFSNHYNGTLNQALANAPTHLQQISNNTQSARPAEGMKKTSCTNIDSSTAPAVPATTTALTGCNYGTNPVINEGLGNYIPLGESKLTTARNNTRIQFEGDRLKSKKLMVLDQHIAAINDKARCDEAGGSSTNMICFGQGDRSGAVADNNDEQLIMGDAFVLVAAHDHEQPCAELNALLHSHVKRRSNVISLQLPGGIGVPRLKKASRHPLGPALNTNLKPRARQGSANDAQSIAARQRRERINSRLKALQELVPNGSKVDLVTMLEKAINYVKLLQLQLKVLTDDEFWSNAQQLIGHEGSSLLDQGMTTEGNSSLESSNALISKHE